MPRLKTTSARLSSPAPRLGAPAGDARAQDRQRYQEKPWRKWYASPRWKKLGRKVIAKQLGLCKQTGVPLVGGKKAPNSAVLDHIQEHKGDPVLFWDEDNVQAVAKSWHDSEKQRQERARHDR